MQRCPLCTVHIHADEVYFHHGKPGSKERLHARVCQHAIARGKVGCINTGELGEITDGDRFGVSEEVFTKLMNVLNNPI